MGDIVTTNDHVDLGWTLGEVADHLGGRLVGDPDVPVRSVITDSRADVAEGLFVALVGPHFDGHRFVDDVLAAGAVAVVVGADAAVASSPRIEVEDTQDALLALAIKRRAEIEVPVVAITGSTGKTSTKDLVAGSITGAWASPRSFNNEVGVPLTILATPTTASAVVVEVGSRGPGHIRWLGQAVRPDVAVVTNLGFVHLETFRSEQGLADAKYELIDLLDEDGIAVIPADEPRLARDPSVATVTFGESGADVEISDVQLDADGYPTFTLTVAGSHHTVALSVAGAHQARNAAAAVCVAVALHRDIAPAIVGLSTVTGSAWRMDIHRGRFTVVNDAYNANPQSVASALDTVAAMEGRRKIAVLGPMAELGSVCEVAHRAMGERAAALGFDVVLVVGADHGYALGAGSITVNATDLEGAADTLHAIVEPGDVVLVKASRSAGLERLALDLIEASTP